MVLIQTFYKGYQQKTKVTELYTIIPGGVAQSVTCLTVDTCLTVESDTCLTADPGAESLTPARSHTFVEIDHEIISTAILHLSA